MQINRWLYLLSSPCGIPFYCNLFWKRIDPKNFYFIGTNNWIVLAAQWSIKYFFAPNSSIFWIRLTEKREEEEYRQLQSMIYFTEKQYLVGPYYAGPKRHCFWWYGIKRVGVICLSMRVWLCTFEKLRVSVIRSNKVIYCYVLFDLGNTIDETVHQQHFNQHINIY